MRRVARPAVTLALTLACAAYLVWKIDLGQTLHVLGEVQLAYFAGALALLFATIPPLAWRWRLLLRARGIDDGLGWLMRAYLVSYAAGQVLPTSLGGDATRIYETTRRHPGRGGAVAGSVLLERVLGGFATLVLAAVGFVLAYGQYDVGAYLWVAAKAVGVDLSPRPFFVMGPLLFLVMLVPFTINGFALRETFFVSFLGKLGVDPDAAFATGFLFFLLSTALALPGAAILVWQGLRPRSAVGAPASAPAEVLVGLHVEPHGEEGELRPRDQQQGDEHNGRGRDPVPHRS